MGAGKSCASCEAQTCRNVGAAGPCGTSEWNPADPTQPPDEPGPADFLHQPWTTGDEADEMPVPEASHPSEPAHCRMRIIAVSDVYLLDNLPALKTLVAAESAGFPPGNVVTALPGDFLAPSLLSSLDSGYSMVKVMNHIPINLVCFGNHDGNDIPYSKLGHRIEEFNGEWLNSNMPDFMPVLPKNVVRELVGEDGIPGARKVAFVGLLIGGGKFQSMYRPEAFGGAHKTIVPVVEAARGAVEACHEVYEGLDAVIPLTHQDMAEDRKLAEMGIFPVVLGGHDHDQFSEVDEKTGCRVVKPGQDAKQAVIIDLIWYSSEPEAKPTVNVQFKAVNDYKADPELAEIVEKAYAPLRELECACLYVIPKGKPLTSVNSRYQDCSLARMMATAVRECLGCDGVILNSGTVRGNREYLDALSYGDLKRECPFESPVVVVEMPFSVLREGVRLSRKNWWDIGEGQARKEAASALQTDDGIDLVDHAPSTIRGKANPDTDKFFRVGCDHYVLGRNLVFKEYCQNNPDRIPPPDAGRPLLPILVEFFCGLMWHQLIDSASNQVMSRESVREFKRRAADEALGDMTNSKSMVGFSDSVHKIFTLFDEDHDDNISAAEMQKVLSMVLGPKLSSGIVVQQLMHMVDADSDGTISEAELHQAIRKMALAG